MSFVEVDVLGVYIAPIVPMMVLAFGITLALRWVAVSAGLFRWIWHPALFEFSVYLIVLTVIVLTVGSLKLP
jgi:protein AaeX